MAYLLRPNPGGVDWSFWSHSGSGEFFLVENRQQTLYDTGLRGCGLLIWHIDESVSFANDANADENHTLVWLEQADGLNELAGMSRPWGCRRPLAGQRGTLRFQQQLEPQQQPV